MQKKTLETLLYSSAGILVMLVLLVAVNVLLGARPVRVDMTREKAYTLSEGTRAVLRKLPAPVKIRFYCTQSQTATPETVFLKDYARKVEDLLREYQEIAGRNLVVEKYDPQPDSDAEDSARLDGLEGQPLSGFERFYLGVSVGLADERVSLPFLAPNRERLLEYDLTRAITQVLTPEKPTIGVLSALPVFGAPGNPMMQRMGQEGRSPWMFIQQLQQDFTVKPVELNAEKIDDDVKVLMVIHPRNLSEATQYAIDQFVLRGGKLLAFLDPQSVLASRQQNPMMGMGGGGSSSSLDRLLKAWGLGFDTAKVVADVNYQLQLRDRNGQPTDAPAWLALTGEGVNPDDIATSQIDNIWLPLAGAFTGTPAAGLKETVLLSSSRSAQLVDSFLAGMDGGGLRDGLKPAGVNYKLAVRLTGKFKTAFPDGRPASPAEAGVTNRPAQPGESLKESATETSVVLFGDTDMVADDFSLRRMDSPFGQLVSPLNANLNLAQNLVEQMAGDSSLIGVRSRATLARPFTRVKQMEAEAQARGQAKVLELQRSLAETQQRVNELQQQRQDKDQRFILSAEQRAELDNFRRKQVEVGKELKQAQKDLRREVVSLETRLKWLNILAMPLGVTLAGVGIAVVKRKKTSAK